LTYEVITMTGARLMGGFLGQDLLTLDVSHLSSGLYFVHLSSDVGVYTHKIVVDR